MIDPCDEQLVDLNVYISDPFPAYDENGNEVIDAEKNEPLVKVMLSEHYGKCVESPFKVETPQVVRRSFRSVCEQGFL